MSMEGGNLNPQEDVSKSETPLERMKKAKEAAAMGLKVRREKTDKQALISEHITNLAEQLGKAGKLAEVVWYVEENPETELSDQIFKRIQEAEEEYKYQQSMAGKDKESDQYRITMEKIIPERLEKFSKDVDWFYDQVMQKKQKQK